MLPGYGTDVLILQKEYRARKSVRRADKNKVFSGLFCAFGAVPFIMTKTAETKGGKHGSIKRQNRSVYIYCTQ